MQIQKLAYFSHGWHLAFTKEPLIDERIEAWDYGPVVSTLYHEFKKWGSGKIEKPATGIEFAAGRGLIFYKPALSDADVEEESLQFAKRLLKKTWRVYGSMSGLALSQLTHDPEGPWAQTRRENPNARSVDIPDDLIRDGNPAKQWQI